MEYLNMGFVRWYGTGFLTTGIALLLFLSTESFSYWQLKKSFQISMSVADFFLRGAMFAFLVGPSIWTLWRYGSEEISKPTGCLLGLISWLVIIALLSIANALRGGGGQEKPRAESQLLSNLRGHVSGGKWR